MGDEGKQMVMPPPAQVGVVVKDVDEAIEYYSRVFGLGPFQIIEFAPDKHWVKRNRLPSGSRSASASGGLCCLS